MQLEELIIFAKGNENFMKVYETHMHIREEHVCPLLSLHLDESKSKDDDLISENEAELEIQDTIYGQNLAKEIEEVAYSFYFFNINIIIIIYLFFHKIF